MSISPKAKRKRNASDFEQIRVTKRNKIIKSGDIVRLNVPHFENQLKRRSIHWRGKYYYPVCLGYRLVQRNGLQATRHAKLQAMMIEASKYFYVSKDAQVISTKTSKIKCAKMTTLGDSGNEQYRGGPLGLRKPIQRSKIWNISLHRLVMYTFDPIFNPEDFVVHHVKREDTNDYFRELDFEPIHGSPTVRSNRFEHLRWTTKRENNQTENKLCAGKHTKFIYPVLATNLTTNKKTLFGSVEEAIKSLNKLHPDKTFRRNCIVDVTAMRRKSHRGYQFEKRIPTLPGEIWKDVPQTNTKVSNFGRIFNTRGLSKGKILHARKGLQYITTQLSYRAHRKGPTEVKCKRVHRLVYEAFHGPISPDMVIDHIDGYGQHNCIKNIHMVTRSENRKNCNQRQISRGKCECGFDPKSK